MSSLSERRGGGGEVPARPSDLARLRQQLRGSDPGAQEVGPGPHPAIVPEGPVGTFQRLIDDAGEVPRPVAPRRPAVELAQVGAGGVDTLHGDQEPGELPPCIGIVRASREESRVAVEGLLPAPRGDEEPRVRAQQRVAPAFLVRRAGKHLQGGVAFAVAVQQQRQGVRIARVRRPLAPEHLQKLERAGDLAGPGEHTSESVARFRTGIRDRFHDPDPPATVAEPPEHLDDDLVAVRSFAVPEIAAAPSLPASRDASQGRHGFLDPAGPGEHERVHAPRDPALGIEPAPRRGRVGGQLVASGASRHACRARGEGGGFPFAGGIDVAPDRPVHLRLATPTRRNLRDEQLPEHSGGKSAGSPLRHAGRGPGGGSRAHGGRGAPRRRPRGREQARGCAGARRSPPSGGPGQPGASRSGQICNAASWTGAAAYRQPR